MPALTRAFEKTQFDNDAFDVELWNGVSDITDTWTPEAAPAAGWSAVTPPANAWTKEFAPGSVWTPQGVPAPDWTVDPDTVPT